MCRVRWRNLPNDQKIVQHPHRSELLLNGRFGSRKVLNPSRHMERPHGHEFQAVSGAPIKQLPAGMRKRDYFLAFRPNSISFCLTAPKFSRSPLDEPLAETSDKCNHENGRRVLELFEDLVEYFLREADPSTRRRTIEAALKHGMTRWQQGYELVEVIRELGIVHRSILDHGIEKFFEENSQWVNSINNARRNLDAFFEDSVAGSVQRYVENFTEQLRSANAKLLKANESLSRIDESRLRLIRTVSHEIANVLNTLNLTMTLVTTGK
jgi:Mg2+ and Co2+ transporter CorA